MVLRSNNLPGDKPVNLNNHYLCVWIKRQKSKQMCEKTEKQHELDKRYLRMAAIWAENSYCKRRQVGALLVKDKMIISDGYQWNTRRF